MVMVIFLGVSLGLAAGTVRSLLVDAPVVQSETGPVMVEGWVQDIEPGRKGVRLMIKVHSVAGMAPAEWPTYLRVTHISRLEVAPGRFVRCWSVLRPPPGPAMLGEYDFRRQAWFEQLGAVGYVQGRCRGGRTGGAARHLQPGVALARRRAAKPGGRCKRGRRGAGRRICRCPRYRRPQPPAS